jgi:hypothetical protein
MRLQQKLVHAVSAALSLFHVVLGVGTLILLSEQDKQTPLRRVLIIATTGAFGFALYYGRKALRKT